MAIIGAGPYGMAAGACLRAAGVDTRVFGVPMGFWQQMPKGMYLRSGWRASRFATPDGVATLDQYRQQPGVTINLSMQPQLQSFVEYGLWVQRQMVPDVDRRHVARLETA